MDTTVYGPVGPEAGHTALMGQLTARTMLPAELTEGRLSIVEHYLDPKELGAPLHRHAREDEYTVVLEGRMGVMLGEDVYEAGPGELLLKPRGQWHAFWNPGQDRARLLEIISPAGFEQFFVEIAEYYTSEREMDMERFMAACDRYALEMDLESMPELIGRFGLIPPPEMTSGSG
ncbi:cupin domain-containing protein [Kocuria sp. CPCC 205292]|uniref:cupin domain-containing protein n=1 Tax=Kocuria cellulosilytica TaxID=3071451 RepID=UPI0034D4C748